MLQYLLPPVLFSSNMNRVLPMQSLTVTNVAGLLLYSVPPIIKHVPFEQLPHLNFSLGFHAHTLSSHFIRDPMN